LPPWCKLAAINLFARKDRNMLLISTLTLGFVATLIPATERRALATRLLIVWALAFVIGLINWTHRLGMNESAMLAVALVYSYAISTSIWLFTDVARFAFRRLLHAAAPSYWPPAGRAVLMLFIGIPLGYALGTLLGDAYSGHSTWALINTDYKQFTGLLLSTLIISLAFVAYFYQRGHAEELKRQTSQSQLMLLQSQLEPHMLFNTLANLRVLIATDPKRAQAMLDHLVAYLRATLGASRQTQHTLQNEFDRVRDYLEIMSVRMGPRLRYTLDLPAALADAPVPTLLLQPLVENALLHGLEPKVGGGHLSVTAHGSGAQLVLLVQDTGCGLAEGNAPSSGFGLAQVRERLSTHYGAEAQFNLRQSAPAGTEARITLPLNTPPTP
jgi:signal transduction histidine kinase